MTAPDCLHRSAAGNDRQRRAAFGLDLPSFLRCLQKKCRETGDRERPAAGLSQADLSVTHAIRIITEALTRNEPAWMRNNQQDLWVFATATPGDRTIDGAFTHVFRLSPTRDPVIPLDRHHPAFQALLEQTGDGPGYLLRAPDRYGHCALSLDELITGRVDLVGCANAGVRLNRQWATEGGSQGASTPPFRGPALKCYRPANAILTIDNAAFCDRGLVHWPL